MEAFFQGLPVPEPQILQHKSLVHLLLALVAVIGFDHLLVHLERLLALSIVVNQPLLHVLILKDLQKTPLLLGLLSLGRFLRCSHHCVLDLLRFGLATHEEGN